MDSSQIAPYAAAVIKLLQGPLSNDDSGPWGVLLNHEAAVRDYLAKIGVELIVNEADGYAFLRQPEWEAADGQRIALPRLIRRDRMSYHVTLLCALLRERLDQFEASTPETDRLIITDDELRDMLRPFLGERGDERALIKKSDETANRVAELGFLRRLKAEHRYEVRPILKARIGSDMLAEVLQMLEQHAAASDS